MTGRRSQWYSTSGVGLRILNAGVIWAGLVLAPLPVSAQPLPFNPVRPMSPAVAGTAVAGPGAAAVHATVDARHVRAVDPKAADLLEQGAARSTTIRSLLDALERSDVVAYVGTASLSGPGGLQFMSASRTCRFVRITINNSDTDVRLLAALGHELQHAVEIAGAPEVRDVDALVRYYQQHGHRNAERVYCTRAAAQAALRVEYEVMTFDPRAAAHVPPK